MGGLMFMWDATVNTTVRGMSSTIAKTSYHRTTIASYIVPYLGVSKGYFPVSRHCHTRHAYMVTIDLRTKS